MVKFLVQLLGFSRLILSAAMASLAASVACGQSLPTPTAYYPLDGDVLDYSGNGNNGTLQGATFISPGYVGTGAIQFNGTSAYVQIPKSIGVAGTGFTIAFWMRTTATGGTPNWYSGKGLVDGEVAGFATDFGTALVGGKFALGIGSPDTTLPSNKTVNDGLWHHVAATWNMTNGAMQVFVDGVLDAITTGPTGPRSAPPNLRLGTLQTGVAGGFFSGTMDDVRLYNSVLSTQQIYSLWQPQPYAPVVNTPMASPSNIPGVGSNTTLTVSVAAFPSPTYYQWRKNTAILPGATNSTLVLSNMTLAQTGNYDVLVGNTVGTNLSTPVIVTVMTNPPPSPVAYYPLSGDVLDYSGNGNNGINNGAGFAAPGEVTAQAAQFNGSSAFVQIPKSIGVTGTGFTVAMWVKTLDTGGAGQWYQGEGLVDGEVAGVTTDFGTALVAGKFALGIGNPDVTLPSNRSINDGTWHHVAATWNMANGAMQVFVDGALDASGTGATGTRTAPPNLRIGSLQTAINFFNGSINDVRLYDSVLNAQQLAVVGQLPASAPIVGAIAASPGTNVYAGTTVTWSVAVTGNPPATYYQWRTNGTAVSGATNSSLVLSNAVVAQSANYDVLVGNAYGTNAGAALQLVVKPASAPVFVSQPSPQTAQVYANGFVTFTALVDGSPPIALQWQHNGTNLPGHAAASLILSNLKTNDSGAYVLVASNYLGSAVSSNVSLAVLPLPALSAMDVLTYQNDNMRTGANTNEFLLTPANVNTNSFGKLYSRAVDGAIYAEPLFVAGVNVPGKGTHNIVYVATQHGSVYAFDADDNQGANASPLWQVNFLNPAAGVTALTPTDVGNCPNIPREECIAATPAIDLSLGTIFVEALTREVTNSAVTFVHRLHALNIATGAEQPNSPVVIQGSVPANGGTIVFDPLLHQCRTGLLLVNGTVYFGYSAQCDQGAYHGWVMAYNEQTLQQVGIYNSTPNGGAGGIWHGGGGMSADASGNLFATTGNGTFGTNYASPTQYNLSDSFIKFASSNGLALTDYFTPYNQANLSSADLDVSAGSSMVLPDSVGSAAHPHLVVGAGKDGTIYLLDREQLGHYNAASDSQIVQELPNAVGTPWNFPVPAYFNNTIYYQGNADVMRAFHIANAAITTTPVSLSTVTFGSPGGIPSVSAAGTNNAIVWALQTDAWPSSGRAVLHAYNANNLAQELYNSNLNPAQDSPGAAVKWTIPMVANGKVYVGANYTLSAYGNGVFLAVPVISPNGGTFTNSITVTLSDATPGTTMYYTLDGTAPSTNSIRYTGPFLLTNSAAVQAIATAPGSVNSGIAMASFLNASAVGHGTGLLGAYYANHTAANPFTGSPTLTRTDAVINFNWNTTGPDPIIGQSGFTVRWTGSVQPQFSETYTFYATVDDGVRLWVNGQMLANSWIDQGHTTYQGSIALNAQQFYNIQMEYYQGGGGAEAMLAWSSPSTTQAIIPQTQLYSYTNPPPSVVLQAPTNGASYAASASVTLSANAGAAYNSIRQVDFYRGNTYLGSISNAPYTLTTMGLSAGAYAFTAVARDGSGLASTSAPVNITVTSGTGQAYGLTNRSVVSAYLNMPATFNGSLPPLLSLTGVFSNTPGMIPLAGLVPYTPNVPFWSDDARKTRFMGVPYAGGAVSPDQQIGFSPTNSWSFPAGTVFIKTFELNADVNNPAIQRRLETRLLVRDSNGQVYGVTYKWRADNSDADLLLTNLSENIWITNGAAISAQTWYYPSPADCLSCHTPVEGYVLGVNTRQLNGNLAYPATGVTDNQLRALNRIGMFNPAINEAGIPAYAQLVTATNQSAPLVDRFRSYIDVNCAQCHQPGGPGPTFDARYDTPLTNQNIIYGSLDPDGFAMIVPQDIWRSEMYQRAASLVPGVKMPPLAKNLLDTNGLAMMAAYINSLAGTPALPPPVIAPNGGNFFAPVTVTLQLPDTNAALYYTLDGTAPTTNSPAYTGPFLLTNSAVVSAMSMESGFNPSVAASAVFGVQPIQFTSAGFTSNHVFQLGFSGVIGSNYVLLASTNFEDWTPLVTNLAVTNLFKLTDPKASNFQYRFYRVLQQ